MAQFPSLPLFTDAVMADCSHLNDDEFGLYMRILIVMWRSPGCRIPAKADWLEKRFKREIIEIGPILAEFCDCDGNWWTQGRLSDEMEWVKKNAKRQSARAKSRWKKEKVSCLKDADVQSRSDAPHPTPPTPIEVSKDTSTPIPPDAIFMFEENAFTADMLFEIFWKEYPSISTKGNKQDARMRFKKLLEKGESHVAIINGCRRYADHIRSTGQYNTHASTFLSTHKGKPGAWLGEWEPSDGRPVGPAGDNIHARALAEGVRRVMQAHEGQDRDESGPVPPLSSDE